jgi:hypothetical protein
MIDWVAWQFVLVVAGGEKRGLCAKQSTVREETKTHVKENSEKEETLRRSPAGRNPARQSMEPCSRKRVMRRQSRGWHEALTVSTEAAGLSHESTNAGVFAVDPAGTVREATRMASRNPSCRGPRPWQRCMKREPCELGRTPVLCRNQNRAKDDTGLTTSRRTAGASARGASETNRCSGSKRTQASKASGREGMGEVVVPS